MINAMRKALLKSTAKKILIGVTGSIAAYKACELIRLFKKSGAEVKIVLTEAALEFVGEKTFETLSNNPVYIDTFQKRNNTMHISLADWADAFVIAPASANTISKIATGVADNLLTSLACAYLGRMIVQNPSAETVEKPLFIAPAMNDGMWNNPFVQQNVERLKNAGVEIIAPIEGELACGTNAVGKMQEPVKIYEAVISELTLKKGKKIVVTSGGTREFIDPVRFITNASSGKMGTSIADAAHDLGYDVTLISTLKVEKPYNVVEVTTADEMKNAVDAEFDSMDCLIMASAVADYKPKKCAEQKIRKNKNNAKLTIELVQNPDILKYIGEKNLQSGGCKKIIGFSLATENVLETAKEKLAEKKCDFIVANEAKTALNTDVSEVWVIDKNQNVKKIGSLPKPELAKAILEIVL